jgi:hypothetical protein
MMIAYASVEVRDSRVLGNRCGHDYIDILYFPFKAILFYNSTHFIEKQSDASTAKAITMTRKCQGP